MLLSNFDQTEGLCNESRLIVNKLVYHVIGTKIIIRKKSYNEVYIPKISMLPSQS